MDRRPLLDLGHPLLNRVADSFIRAAGVGAARAVSREAYFVTIEGLSGDSAGLDPNGGKRSHFSSIRGDDGQKSLDAVVRRRERRQLLPLGLFISTSLLSH
jgi:hypothetical protein